MFKDPKDLKLYIAVLDEVPDHMVPVIVAHAMLRAHAKFSDTYSSTYYDSVEEKDCWHTGDTYPLYTTWYTNSFKKVVLRVNRREFSKIKELDNVVLTHENSTLDKEDCCAVVCPEFDYPNVLKCAKMWSPKNEEYERLVLKVRDLERRIAKDSWELEGLRQEAYDRDNSGWK